MEIKSNNLYSLTDNGQFLLPAFGTINVSKFDKDAFYKFRSEFEWCVTNQQNIIPVYIDSYGGSVSSALGMIDIIKSSKSTVATIAVADAMSAGALLLTAGSEGYRYASKYSRIMLHSIWTGFEGSVESIEKEYEELIDCKETVLKMLDENCLQKKGTFKEIFKKGKNTNMYLSAQKAKKMNIINHVGLPVFKQQIDYKVIITNEDSSC